MHTWVTQGGTTNTHVSCCWKMLDSIKHEVVNTRGTTIATVFVDELVSVSGVGDPTRKN